MEFECWIENWKTLRNPQSKDEDQQQTQPTCDACLAIEPRPQWLEASALTITMSLLVNFQMILKQGLKLTKIVKSQKV